MSRRVAASLSTPCLFLHSCRERTLSSVPWLPRLLQSQSALVTQTACHRLLPFFVVFVLFSLLGTEPRILRKLSESVPPLGYNPAPPVLLLSGLASIL